VSTYTLLMARLDSRAHLHLVSEPLPSASLQTRRDLLGGWLLIAHYSFQSTILQIVTIPRNYLVPDTVSRMNGCTEGFRVFQQFGGVACKVQTSQVVNLTPPIWHLLKVHFEGVSKNY
jgi:hypothetical protein